MAEGDIPLLARACAPCTGDTPRVSERREHEWLRQLPGWRVTAGKLTKTFRRGDFRDAMRFVNSVAELAEREAHHPDFCVSYARVEFSLSTHAIDALSENDFVLAAKIDALA
jgi:4a-hydroxytetrahydrobiopterin dehydratase